jgi:hypothetical protein
VIGHSLETTPTKKGQVSSRRSSAEDADPWDGTKRRLASSIIDGLRGETEFKVSGVLIPAPILQLGA